jgi:hypothetical protein
MNPSVDQYLTLCILLFRLFALITQTWRKVLCEEVPEFDDLVAGLLAHTFSGYLFDIKVFVVLTHTFLLFRMTDVSLLRITQLGF